MYLEIDEGFPGHRKTLRLCSMLKDPNAGWYMIRLWTWACRSCPDGNLDGMSPDDIEMAVGYQKADGNCYKAMIDSKYIDANEDGSPKKIHNWEIRQGAAIKRLESHAASMREARARKKAARDEHVTSTLESRDEHVRTSPVQSSPDKTRQERETLARDPGTTEHAPEWRVPRKWYDAFGLAWCKRYNKISYGDGESDAKACARLGDLLTTMAPSDLEEAWGFRLKMFDDFFRADDKAAIESKHPFSFFVPKFRALMVRDKPKPKKVYE